jgi:hypothetical protein
MENEQRGCPAMDICKKLESMDYYCINIIPPIISDNDEINNLKRISFQLQEIKGCLHSIVLLLGKSEKK